jgi:hypothetical protein
LASALRVFEAVAGRADRIGDLVGANGTVTVGACEHKDGAESVVDCGGEHRSTPAKDRFLNYI